VVRNINLPNNERFEQMKKIGVLLTVILMVSTVLSSVTLAAEMPLRVVVDKDKVEFLDAKPFKDEEARIQVPLRFVSEALGAKVRWDHESRTAMVNLGARKLVFTIDKEEYTINGESNKMDTKALLKDTRIFVPVRYVSEGLGATVKWDESINTVYIDTTTIIKNLKKDWEKPWQEEHYGFTVTYNTGSKLSIYEGSYDELGPNYTLIEFSINFDTNGANYDMQIKEVEEILLQQVNKDKVDAIMKLVKKKTTKAQGAGYEIFTDDTYEIIVDAEENNNTLISVFYK
jgi:Copper amine oxidase N-terminal domain